LPFLYCIRIIGKKQQHCLNISYIDSQKACEKIFADTINLQVISGNNFCKMNMDAHKIYYPVMLYQYYILFNQGIMLYEFL